MRPFRARPLRPLLVGATVGLAIASLCLLVLRPQHSHYGLFRGTMQETIVITPGPSVAAFYLLLALLTAVPSVTFGLLLLPARRREGKRDEEHEDTLRHKGTSRGACSAAISEADRARGLSGRARLLCAGLFLVGVCLSSAVCGFGYEALQSEIRMDLGGIAYRAGSSRTYMAWRDIRAIRLRMRPLDHFMELHGHSRAVRLDLTSFASPDQRLLVAELPALARLARTPELTNDGWLWRRREGIQIAPHRLRERGLNPSVRPYQNR